MSPASKQTDYAGLGSLLDHLVASGALPGASILVSRKGREAYYHEAGAADIEDGRFVRRDTLFRIFSMTKPLTAAALMCLVDDGKVALTDPVSRYIPEFSGLGAFAGVEDGQIRTTPARAMVVEHLLTHTAGLSYWFQPNFSYWREVDTPVAVLYDEVVGAGRFERWRFDPALGGLEGLARSLARVPLLSQPGERWHYSMALEVAGLIVERASGKSLDVFMRERLFDPLGMTDTAFSVPAEKAGRLASLYGLDAQGALERLERGQESPLLGEVCGLSGGGGLVSAIDDYSRFAEMLADGGHLGGRRVLSPESVRLMMTDRLAAGQLVELPELALFGLGGQGDGLGFGLGGAVMVDPDRTGMPAFRGEYSWGGAASTTFWVDPQNHLTVVFMTQLLPPSAEMLRDKLHTAVYAALGL